MTGRRTSRRLSSQISDIVENVLEEKENSRKSTRRSVKPAYTIDEEDDEATPEKKPRRERALSTKALENAALDVSDILAESPVRKSTRGRKSKKLDEGFVYESPSRKKRTKKPLDDEESDKDEPESDLEELDAAEKPENLFTEEIDVAGSQMFGFKTPKKRDGMSLLAYNTPKTPQNLQNTPKSAAKRNVMKTPSHVRSKIKEKLTKIALANDSEDDFSSDHSDYNPDSSTSSSENDEDDAASDNSDTSEVQKAPKKPTAIQFPMTPSASGRGRNRKDVQYVLESDTYFNSHASSKVTTSNHTLDRLKNPRLEHDKLFKLLSEMSLTNAHEKSIKAMNEEYRTQFAKWIFLFNEGFNIVMHGLGSKRNLLSQFHKEILAEKPVIVINGFFPSLTLKEILDAIIVDVLEVSPTGTPELLVDQIESEFKKIPETHLFLLVHNLDGVMLRNDRAQSVLSRLASVPNIHLIATIDHINTPLLWDYSKLTSYNFIWWDCTTMLPYKDETAYENSMLIQNSGALALSSMKNVFLSLTTNGRGIYMIIVRSQLNNKGNPNYQGMAFKDLYSSCRENFLVSSDLALRAQLTEFLDHKMVKIKRAGDGTEYLNIPIEYGLLTQFTEEQEKL
ncbi:origin recognition complex subunit 2 [Culicoides brevitarsis]|uniref:origin recognition complex subunit 2 n=1 Tax=Culicoides brevitarsis TaxID=469753 RepID=UPI00307B8636